LTIRPSHVRSCNALNALTCAIIWNITSSTVCLIRVQGIGRVLDDCSHFSKSTKNRTRLQKGGLEGEVGGVGRVGVVVSKLQTIESGMHTAE
jgi:hypothetical protein